MLMTNQNFGNLLVLLRMIDAPIGHLVVTEKGTLRWMLEIAPFLLPLASKDIECIQIASLNSVVDPHDVVQMIGKCLTNAVILAFDLGNHIIAHQNDNLPIPIDFIHVGVTSLNLGLIGTACDLLPGHFGKIGLLQIQHRGIIGVARDQNSQLLGVVGEFHPFAEVGEKLVRAFPRGTLQQDSHYSFKRHIA